LVGASVLDTACEPRRYSWRQVVLISAGDLFGYREGQKGFDLPIGRSDHRCVGTPQNVIGSKTVEQVTDEDSIPRRIGPHHPGQAAELRLPVCLYQEVKDKWTGSAGRLNE
jgi:hypothetical protein